MKKNLVIFPKNVVSPNSPDVMGSKTPLLSEQDSPEGETTSGKQNAHEEDTPTAFFKRRDFQNFYADYFDDLGLHSQSIMNSFLFAKPKTQNTSKETEILENYSRMEEAVKEYFTTESKGFSLYQPDYFLELRKKHSENIFSILISPDATQIFTGSEDLSIRVWDIATMKLVYTLRGHTNVINGFVMPKNRQILFSGGREGNIRVWSLANRKQIHLIRAHTHWIFQLALTLDQTRVFSSSQDKKICIWDCTTFQLVHTIEVQAKYIRAMAFTPFQLITAGMETIIRFFDLTSYEEVDKVEEHTSEVTSVDVNSDYTLLISGSNDKNLIIWDLKSKKILSKLEHKTEVYSVRFSGDCSKIISQNNGGQTRFFDTKTFAVLHEHSASSIQRRNVLETNPLINAVFTVMNNPKRCVVRFNLDSYEVQNFDEPDPFGVKGTAVKTLRHVRYTDKSIVFSIENIIYVWDISKDELKESFTQHSGEINALVVNGDNFIISGDLKGSIKFFNLNTLCYEGELDCANFKYDNVIAEAAEDSIVYFTTKDFKICRWDLESNKLLGNAMEGHTAQINAVYEFYFGERILASGGADKTLIFWNPRKTEKMAVLEGSTDPIYRLLYSSEVKSAFKNKKHSFSLGHEHQKNH